MTAGPTTAGLRAWIRARRQQAVELLCELVRTDSVSGREGPIAELGARWLRERGVEAELWPCKDRHNLVAAVGEGPEALVLAGHLDTVPPDAAAWSRDPWDPELRGGRVWGLGASDLKASMAASWLAQLWLAEQGLPGRAISAFTIEEETTGDGTRAFLERALESGFLLPEQAACVVTEPTGLREVCLSNSGTAFVSIGVRGRGGHGSRPHLAQNPIETLGRILAQLPDLAARWAEEHADRPVATLSPTSVRAGEPAGHNVIPDSAQCVLDLRVGRSLYAEDFAELRRSMDAWLAGFAGDEVAVTWRLVHRRPGHELAADHPLVAATMGACAATGLEVVPAHTTAGNDAVFFGRAGIPTINKLGPGLPECAHRTDEYVEVEHLLLAAELYARLAVAWLDGRS